MASTDTEKLPYYEIGARLRKACVADARAIQALINLYAERDEMLHRSLGEIYENIRDFYVVETGEGEIVACGGLHVVWSHLAEIKSLAVKEPYQGCGLGKAIALACVEEAQDLGLKTVFALTYKPEFFARIGFKVVDKATLPHKVWNECVRCPKFPGCGEIAMVRELAPATEEVIPPAPVRLALPLIE
ncbi:MAG: N-acetyltransferase [Armatimonadetes bacterium]|nr:N-acetyltransferase [Armatimonadota bacterium]